MDKTEARAVLVEQLAAWRKRAYAELASMVGSHSVIAARGASGAEYQIEIEVLWDSPRERVNVLVSGGVDDGRGLASLFPLCESFIVAPDGRFVGE